MTDPISPEYRLSHDFSWQLGGNLEPFSGVWIAATPCAIDSEHDFLARLPGDETRAHLGPPGLGARISINGDALGYVIEHEGKRYPSKGIYGVASGIELP